MDAIETLRTDLALSILGSLLGAIWTLFKTSEWRERRRNRRLNRAVQALEAAVEQTYRTYVRAIKTARQDGKLTDAERRQARELARQRAIEFARIEGIDVVRELGANYLDLWITRLVSRLRHPFE